MPVWMAVEDEANINDIILSMFEVWGVDGLPFSDGAEAIAWIEQLEHELPQENLPELALLDLRMPKISGIEVAMKIRATPRLSSMAIVLMTAYHLNPEKEAHVLHQTQADLLLYKPLPAMRPLRTALENALTNRKRDNQSKP